MSDAGTCYCNSRRHAQSEHPVKGCIVDACCAPGTPEGARIDYWYPSLCGESDCKTWESREVPVTTTPEGARAEALEIQGQDTQHLSPAGQRHKEAQEIVDTWRRRCVITPPDDLPWNALIDGVAAALARAAQELDHAKAEIVRLNDEVGALVGERDRIVVKLGTTLAALRAAQGKSAP